MIKHKSMQKTKTMWSWNHDTYKHKKQENKNRVIPQENNPRPWNRLSSVMKRLDSELFFSTSQSNIYLFVIAKSVILGENKCHTENIICLHPDRPLIKMYKRLHYLDSVKWSLVAL